MKFFAVATRQDGQKVTLGWSRTPSGAQKRINWSKAVDERSGASEASNMGYVSFEVIER
jgi:hypothetical protein